MPPELFTSFAGSAAQHVKLYRLPVNQKFELTLPQTLAGTGWPLRTLYLELHWQVNTHTSGTSTPLCESILRACAPTLERLVWRGESLAFAHPPGSHVSLRNAYGSVLRFPRLRELGMKFVRLKDCKTLEAFLGPDSNIRILDIAGKRDGYDEYMESRGQIRSLETFVWSTFSIPVSHELKFLRANTQIHKLQIPNQQPVDLLDQRVLPALSQSYTQLTSLSLTWQGNSISSSALSTIASIATLEQLDLSAGVQHGWRHTWPIEHDLLRKHLRNLPSLKRLAFRRDSYDNGCAQSSSLERYYEDKYGPEYSFEQLVGAMDLNSAFNERADKEFEEWHKERMLGQVEKYAEVLPKLEWAYFGQMPMGIARDEDGGMVVEALYGERDECWTLLNRMFGRESFDGN